MYQFNTSPYLFYSKRLKLKLIFPVTINDPLFRGYKSEKRVIRLTTTLNTKGFTLYQGRGRKLQSLPTFQKNSKSTPSPEKDLMSNSSWSNFYYKIF